MVSYTGLEIAVIGLSGRFPQGDNVQEFWNNLKNEKNCISQFSEEELLVAGESESILKDVNYVKFGSCLKEKTHFDSTFFNYRPDEAKLMDPQIRLFHECCWEALEDSGLIHNNPANEKIGLFASASANLNWGVYALLKNSKAQLVDNYSVRQLSDVNYLCSMISYKLNLSGPVMFLQTACSSSLAAIHQACNSLLLGECSIALAGGVTLNNFSKRGYLFRVGEILSADGKCCPFDHKASGTVFGEGAGVVVLKRLKDAMKDGDSIHAIIKGSAINNDGDDKVGYTAPSVNRQAEVISKAMKNAGVEPDSISYVEAHGTGTELGDPIEVAALSQAFRTSGSKGSKYCMLGSVKSNIGHLDAASGVAGFIKVVMALKNKQVPATLHYELPNPNIDFNNTPFYVNDRLTEWNRSLYPLRAGISSLGIGGTNVHMILEEAPSREASSSGRPSQLLTMSGKTPEALRRNVTRLGEYLEQNAGSVLADVAYTLNAFRKSFDHRKVFVCNNYDDIIRQLSIFKSEKIPKEPINVLKHSRIVFMFPGQGAQYPGMCIELFNHEQAFREEMEHCFEIIRRQSEKDIKSVLFSDNPDNINNTAFAQPALFIVEYSLARLLMSWGIQPDIMIGHSIGEYVAACLSGVFTLDDALKLVVMRGELMSKMERGSMLSISISEEELQSYLEEHRAVSLAAVNSPSSCVVAGEGPVMAEFKALMEDSGYPVKKLNTSHAFHSHMMDGMLTDFEQVLKQVQFGLQKIPVISNVTGKRAADEDISKPDYWISQLRTTVRFCKGISTIMTERPVIFLEVGPGKSLGSFVGANDQKRREHKVIHLLSRYTENNDSLSDVLKGVGELWTAGIAPDWKCFYAHEKRCRISLPGYSFEPTKYPADVDVQAMIMDRVSDKSSQKKKDLLQWFYTPTWMLSSGIFHNDSPGKPACTLLFADDHGVSETIAERLRDQGDTVIVVRYGSAFQKIGVYAYILIPGKEQGYQELFVRLKADGLLPARMVHCWGITEKPDSADLCFYSLVSAFKTAQRHKSALKEVTVLTSGLHNVLGQNEIPSPYGALGISLLKVISQEYPTIVTGHIDISLPEAADLSYRTKLITEIMHPQPGKIVSYRNRSRWALIYDKVQIQQSLSSPGFKTGGVYLITGGLGGFGFTMSKYLSKYYKAKLILLGRQSLTDERSKRIKAIEDEGGEVLYFDCDISDRYRFSSVLKVAEERVGTINGVFHAAGITGGRSVNSIDQLEKADFEMQFSPKINGLMVLYETLKNRELDFCLLTSSLASVLGGIGFGAYAPANIFMDYFIHKYKRQGSLKNWVSINLDGIDFYNTRSDLITTGELPDVIKHTLLLKELPQLVVSAKELQPRLDDWINKKNLFELPEDETKLNETGEVDLTGDDLSAAERKLMKLWVNFFGRADFGIDDDFFVIGGDSLKALTLIARINKELNVNISLADFFKKPLIRGLAVYLSEANGEMPSSIGNGSIKRAPIRDYYHLSPSQRRLYYLYELDTSSLAYNTPQVIRLVGDLDRGKLTTAFARLIGRHESLRTSFEVVEGQVVQKIADQWKLEIEQMECSEDGAKELINEFIRPFDLSKGPLVRVGLIKWSDQGHLLLVDMHHIITDGVSFGILVRDFMALYNSEDLAELQLQYKDYSEWQQGLEQQEQLSGQRDFWKQEFVEEVSVLDLPADHPRPLVKSYKGSNVSFTLDKEETRELRAIGEQTGATLFMTVLSVFNILLSKLSNQEDITVGVGIAGRHHVDLEGIMGMFVNTLALRNYPGGELSFRQFLLNVKAKVLLGLDNQLYPYEELINTLRIARETSRNPLFDVMFTFQNFDQEELVIPGLTLSPFGIVRHMAKVDIELTVRESKDELYLDFEYSTDLFEEQTIKLFISYFRQIVKVVTKDSETPLSEIDILTAEERYRLLYTFNAPPTDDPGDRTIVELFTEQVKKTPDRVAVRYLSRELSYRDLDEKSNHVANHLKTLGVGPGHLVGILQEPSDLLLVSILGVLKAGGAFVPIDKDYPESRKRHIVEHSGLGVVLTKEDVASMLSGTPEGQMYLRRIAMDGLAYVLYTSGSTGLPKGAMISHSSLVNYLTWARDTYIRGEEGAMALFSSISFDLTITSMFLPLITGNTLYVYQQEQPSILIERVVADGLVKVLKLTPSHLKLLRESNADLTRIRCMIVGGESFDTGLAETISDRGNDALEIYNEYGPTEATVGCVIHRYDRREAGSGSSVLIGKPAPNNEIYILDDRLNLLPRGVAGEIYIGGRQLFRGYIAADDQTAARLLPNPFIPGKRMYKTGDQARWLPDGSIEFLGRQDDQVKIRGYRIELGEIESQLMRHPAIKEAVALVRERDGEKYLTAYYVSASKLNQGELRNHLSGSLPEYMLPASFVAVTSMPLTVNGKLDKNALPEEDIAPPEGHAGPVTKEEKILCEVWSKVLRLENVGVTDDFFSIGGDSIRSIQICSRIKKEGYKLTVKDIITHRTIRALASLLQRQVTGHSKDPAIVTGAIPLTGIQHWFFEHHRESIHHYNQTVMLNFPGRITEEEARAIFTTLQFHHDALRMNYMISGLSVLQNNQGLDHPISLSVQDLREEVSPREKLLSLCNDLQSGIDLEQGPVVKAGLFNMSDGSRLLIAIHHLVIDGISWRILFEDIETLYHQVKSGGPMKLNVKTDSFKLWSEKLRSEYIGSKGYKEAVSYWNTAFDREALRITPTDPGGSNRGMDTVTSRFRLSKILTGQLLGEVHSTFNTRINDLLLAGFLVSVNDHYGAGALQLDLEGHGREEILERVDVSRTVGWFTSIFPAILEQQGEDHAGLIKTVKETLRTIPNNGIDYLIGRYLTGDIPSVRPSRINFNYLGQFDGDTEGRAFSIATEPTGDTVFPSAERVYDWEVAGMVSQGRLEMYITYSGKRFAKEKMEQVMASYESRLKELIACCLSHGRQELTPSDLTYKGLTPSQLKELQKQLINHGH